MGVFSMPPFTSLSPTVKEAYPPSRRQIRHFDGIMALSLTKTSFLLLTNTPKEEEMLRQALLQGWPKADFTYEFDTPESKNAVIICWGAAFKAVLPELLQDKQVVVIFESKNEPTRVEALQRGLAQIVLPAENRTAFLCEACQYLMNHFLKFGLLT